MHEIKIEKLIRSKRRTLSIEINSESQVIIRAPLKMPKKLIEDFINEKRHWIITKLEQSKKKHNHKIKEFREGEKFLFLGKELELKITEERTIPLKIEGDYFIFRNAHHTRAKKIFTAWYRSEAFRIISESVIHYSKNYKINYNEIKLSNAGTRWGSCSPNGNLNFNWRLVMAPREVIDYVVVHELAHIEIKDHSRKFWNKVQSIIPDYKIRRKWLKEHGGKMFKMV